MLEPDPDKKEPADESDLPPTGKVLPFPPRERPDWLTRPEDEIMGAVTPGETEPAAPGQNLPAPVLHRPAPRTPAEGRAPAEGGSGAGPARILPMQPRVVPKPPAPVAQQPPSVPADAAAPAAPASGSPAEGRAPTEGRAPAEGGSGAAGAWRAAGSSIPVLRESLDAEPEPARPARVRPAPPPDIPSAAEDRRVTPAAAPELKPLEEPWWVLAMDALRSDLRVQIGVGTALLCVVLLAFWMWPRGVGHTRISDMRRNAAAYDGRSVVVRGRVGDDVFTIGGGWAFFLTQGRDTIVTFTRLEAPKPRSVVTFRAEVSTGFLDGVPRQALFVTAPSSN